MLPQDDILTVQHFGSAAATVLFDTYIWAIPRRRVTDRQAPYWNIDISLRAIYHFKSKSSSTENMKRRTSAISGLRTVR